MADYTDDNSEIEENYRRSARFLFTTGNTTPIHDFLQTLLPVHRHELVRCLVHEVVISGDGNDANLVASFFSAPSVRRLCKSHDTLMRGFTADMEILEDSVLDNPRAYDLMACMMCGCAFDADQVETLADMIRGHKSCRDKFLVTYSTFSS